MDIRQETINLIDALKATCQTYGMGNDGNEYKIITQVFLYKFLNDKFGHEVKKISTKLLESKKWELTYQQMSEDERLDLFDKLSPDIPRLLPEHLISNLWNQQSKGDFDLIFDSTMIDIADKNIDIFSTQTSANTKIPLFEKLTPFVTDDSARSNFARALVDRLVNFSFEKAFVKNYDFFATVFEYLIKDYNTAGGGKYAEYYTPHSIATIMARLLVGESKDFHNIECYDPSAGTGTLLMALAHKIGEDRCTIYSQDISQRSNKMLKLNLILNNLVASLDHAVQGDTLVFPYHKSDDNQNLRQFDFVVSNPPFKMDFSDTHEKISAMPVRFWAGVPNIPKKEKDSMAIYTLFIQHVINSLKDNGKGAIVVPTGFLTANGGVENKILKRIINDKIVYGCISMPSNVFANTGTNVSVIFFDKSKKHEDVILVDASNMGEDYQENGLKKKRLTDKDIDIIIDSFVKKKEIKDFSVKVNFSDLRNRYSLAAGPYFDIEMEYVELSEKEFNERITTSISKLRSTQEMGTKYFDNILEYLQGVSNVEIK
ncbi:SAM-dependent methyltransferase [Tenericutes bacterium MO-XQ]|nr:SAM-dependent methyltransferase [Tenericutes bacterium MO-XQ]